MFKELVPILRQRAVLLTVTFLEEDQIRVNVVPMKIKDGDNDALTTPLSVTGTAEELDAELSSTLVDFVASHLQLKNTLEKAKSEMEGAARAAQAEARAKAKTPAKKEPPKADSTKPAATTTPAEVVKPEPPKTASLFDAPISAPAPVSSNLVSQADPEDEAETVAEIDEDERVEEAEEFGDAA
jgi:PRTRC genetic system protein E